MTAICELVFQDWQPSIEPEEQAILAAKLEAGSILFFPELAFQIEEAEEYLLSIAPKKAKNISYNPNKHRVGGVETNGQDLADLEAFMTRYQEATKHLVLSLFPQYASMQTGLTSLRTVEAQGRPSHSFRKDDTRLHVDAFPSRPTHGRRLLRVFCNINPGDAPRVWKAGEAFEPLAKRFIPSMKKYSPLRAALKNAVGITRSFQTQYDNMMLQLHHLMKEDIDYQNNVQQTTVEFPPGSVWIVFSDQVSHAVVSGQHMLEQTFYLPVEAMYDPLQSPLKVLERLTERQLV